MVITLAAHPAVTPAGRPVGAPIPEAYVVVWVIFVRAVLIQTVGVDEGGPATGRELTVIAIVLGALVPHPLTAETDSVPEVAPAAKSTVTELVVPLMVAPVPE